MRYNNYHKHDHISNIFSPDTNTKQIEYIKKCVEYGHTNYFTTNHGSMGDIFEAKTLCDEYGLRCLAGLEGYIVRDASEKDKANYHIIIIPRTNKARKKLNKISSHANIDGYYYKPRLFLNDLLSLNKNDVYITTACCGGLLKTQDSIDDVFYPLYNHFGDSIYLEVQSHDDEFQKEINLKCLYYRNQLGLKLIAANDSHYVDETGKQERLELLKGKNMNYGSEDTYTLDFPDSDTMVDRFKKQGILNELQIKEAIESTLIFDKCEEIQINKEIKMPSIYKHISTDERVEVLSKMVHDRFKDIVVSDSITNEEIDRYLDGINTELKIVADTNDVIHTADYFLFNEKMVDLAVNKYNGVLTRGGRGSCGSFYINRILGMTQLDRFRIDLPIFPERFGSTARLLENRALPDIDYNVKEQQPFVLASRELLGENGCFPMIAYGTMQEGEAFRNVCRSKGMAFDEFNDVAKNIDNYRDDMKWKPIIEEASRYVGTIISASVHPCAHILSDEDITEEYGVVRIGENICVMITSNEADEYKVLKNDYLIVKVWKLIDEAFKMSGLPIPPAKELLDSIKDDERVWDLFKNGITCTLNQVDSDNGTGQAKKYGIKSFEDGAFIAAAIRPSFDSWREGFLNKEEYTTGSKHLDEVLKQTKSYILFQENLMQYFAWLGVSPADSIGLIKKISKKKIKQKDFDDLEVKLKENWIKNTGSIDMFDETWKMIQSCISYGFCSAHAAATSLDMCYGAYLKIHHTYEYYCVCLNNYSDDLVRTNKLKNELKYFGIEVSGVKFRKSRGGYSFDKDDKTIYKGMTSIKFISNDCAETLYALKDNTYNTFMDLLVDIKNNTSTNSRQLDILIKLDFFSEFGNAGKLLKCVELFDSLYGKKQIKKDKVIELGIVGIEKYATKETEKMFTGADTLSFLKELETTIKNDTLSLCVVIKTQTEYIGYVDIIDEKYKSVVVVISLDTKYSPKLKVYALANGNTLELKIDKKTYCKNILGVGDIIKIDNFYYKPQQTRNEQGKWVDVPDTKVLWLSEYHKVNL